MDLNKVMEIRYSHTWNIEQQEFNNMYEKLKAIISNLKIPFHVGNKFNGENLGRRAGCVYINDNYPEKVVCIGNDWFNTPNVLALVTIAHEMGHWIDIEHNFKGNAYEYNRILGTLETEVRAWENAIDFLHDIGYTHWEELNIFMKDCLGSYYQGGWNIRRRDNHFGYNGGLWRDFNKAQNDIMARCYNGTGSL